MRVGSPLHQPSAGHAQVRTAPGSPHLSIPRSAEDKADHPPRTGEGDRAKRGGGGSPPLQRPVVYQARKLRRDMSPPEAKLWQQLRLRPAGLKFRRQHPIEPYVVDFFCRQAALIVEVDGWAHDTTARAASDDRRAAALAAEGFSILRFSAGEVMRDVASAVAAIVERAGSPLHHASHGPPPRERGGQ